MSSYADLLNLGIFKGLALDEIILFAEKNKATFKEYAKGERVLHAYGENRRIGMVAKGKAQLVTEDWLGNENLGRVLDEGSLLGAVSAILSAEYSGASVDAAESLTVLWIPYRSLLIAGPKLGRIHGIVMQNILEEFCFQNVRMVEKLEILSKKILKERIILYLLQQERKSAEQEVSPVRVKVPGRVQMARELDCNRSALTREISLMEKMGMLRVGRDWMELIKEKIA